MKLIYCLMAAALLQITTAKAQENEGDKKRKFISIGSNGVKVGKEKKDAPHVEKPFEAEFAIVDIGLNGIQDKTDYTSAATKIFLQVPATLQNENLFTLNNGKSWNVNVWVAMAKLRLAKTNGQKIYLYTGLGTQSYNFRFTRDVRYVNNPLPSVILDSVNFSKNKLAVTYLSIPLGFTFKTKMAPKAWLVYGFGVTGGYRISSLTKQKSSAYGMQKDHDKFNLNDFNSCATAEFGIDGIFRLYASYQLTALHENALDQHPFCIGVRIGGI